MAIPLKCCLVTRRLVLGTPTRPQVGAISSSSSCNLRPLESCLVETLDRRTTEAASSNTGEVATTILRRSTEGAPTYLLRARRLTNTDTKNEDIKPKAIINRLVKIPPPKIRPQSQGYHLTSATASRPNSK
jgi:hypothetical protein